MARYVYGWQHLGGLVKALRFGPETPEICGSERISLCIQRSVEKEKMMISLRGMHEWWHFNETGDLGPLFKVLEDGALAPAVQQMIANDQKLKHPGAFYLTAA